METMDTKGSEHTFLGEPSTQHDLHTHIPTKAIFTLGEQIGSGRFADVYSAHQGSLRRNVAVKQIRDQNQKNALRIFYNEMWLTAGLNHPNILPIHDLVLIDGRPSLVMKLVNGQDWNEVLQINRMQEAAVLHHEIQRLVDVCDAVAFAHSRGVLHLDLKPANVMCGAFGETLVTDWGCAALFDDSWWRDQPDLPRTQHINKPFGTPAFMAPELARGEGTALGVHTDIYALGAILHVLLSNAPLRDGKSTRDAVVLAARGQRLPLPSNAPAALAQLCHHATEANIHERLSDITIFRQSLQHWLDTIEPENMSKNALETMCIM